MNSSISASSRHQARHGTVAPRATRATAIGLLAGVLMLAAIELAYRAAGGIPSIEPGQTSIELAWRLAHAHGTPCVVVVGDSRVGWGFSERVFDRRLRSRGELSAHAVNAGLAATPLDAVVRFVTRAAQEPSVMVVALSPGSCYCFSNSVPDDSQRPPTVQELADEEIGLWLGEHLTTWQRGLQQIESALRGALHGHRLQQTSYVARTTTPEGCLVGVMANSSGTPVPLARLELSDYRQLFAVVRAHRRRSLVRRDAVIDALRAARSAGWRLMLVRLPAGPRMRALEDALPAELAPQSIARQVGLPLLDYGHDRRTDTLPTLDESHLSPASARVFSAVLADDVAQPDRLVRR